jgi:hypothetical protein
MLLQIYVWLIYIWGNMLLWMILYELVFITLELTLRINIRSYFGFIFFEMHN